MAGAKAPRFLEGRRHPRRFSRAGPTSVQSSLSSYQTAISKCKQFSKTRVSENDADCIVEINDSKIRRVAQDFFVIALDQNRATTRGVGAIDIAPAIAYDITPFKINVQLRNCPEDQTWPRLTAIARVAVTLASVIANLDAIK